MKTLLTLVLLIFFVNLSFANVAQPGMWNTGYGTRFTPLFEEDTIHFGKVQMQKELVLINLYPGFAAVKGEYWMYNTADKPITMTVGYPVNGSYEEEKIGDVMYEDLYNLKVIVNDKIVPTSNNADSLTAEFNYEKWYYWETTFQPKTVTKVTVYFLTDNSKAHLRNGYNREQGNAFTYVLESGRAWGAAIGNGQILLNLNGGLTLKNIKGILPEKTLKGDNTHLQFTFNNLEPYPQNNILIWYEGQNTTDVYFDKTLQKAETYFRELDHFPVAAFNKSSFKVIEKDNFKVKDTASKVFWGIMIFIGLLFLALIAGFIYLIYRIIRHYRKT